MERNPDRRTQFLGNTQTNAHAHAGIRHKKR